MLVFFFFFFFFFIIIYFFFHFLCSQSSLLSCYTLMAKQIAFSMFIVTKYIRMGIKVHKNGDNNIRLCITIIIIWMAYCRKSCYDDKPTQMKFENSYPLSIRTKYTKYTKQYMIVHTALEQRSLCAYWRVGGISYNFGSLTLVV